MDHSLSVPLLVELQSRGYIYQATNLQGLENTLNDGIIHAYIGFDCTAESLHVGNLMQIMLVRNLLRHGNKVTILLGGATTKIGDPSDKTELRRLISADEIDHNKNGIVSALKQFLPIGSSNCQVVDNRVWLEQLGYIEFLSEYGRYFSINRMLGFESVKLRLSREQPLSFLEFNYMLLQAYDFLELYRRYGVTLQFGGSEQWGNIVSGIDLARRLENVELFGITTPLITNSQGHKMGKSVSGAVWLRKEMLSPYDYWQFWRNVADEDVIKFLRIYTELPLIEIAKLEKLEGQDINDAKVILANEATKMCHGEEASNAAHHTALKTFVGHGSGEQLPRHKLDAAALKEGVPLYKLLVETEMCSSANNARKLIDGHGVRINGELVEESSMIINSSLFALNAEIKLSVGKKRHLILYTQ